MIVNRARAALALLIAMAGLGLPLDPLSGDPAEPASTTPAAEVDPAVPVAIVAPLVVPPGDSAFIGFDTLEEYTLPGGLLDRQLTDIAQTNAAIGIDPRVLASIRILGKDAPESALGWLRRLDELSNETFPLAWADADVLTPLRAGASTLLAPTSLAYAIEPGRYDEGQSPAPAPTPSAGTGTEPGQPMLLPTAADLTAWDYTYPHLVWPSRGTLVTGDLTLLSAAGYAEAIADSADLDRTRAARGAATRVEEVLVATADSVLSAHFAEAVTAPTTGEWSAATAQLSAELAALSEASAAQPPTVLLALNRSWSTDGYRLAETVAAIMPQPWVTGATLADALEAKASDGEVSAGAIDEARVERVAELLAAEAGEVKFLSVVAEPLAATSPRRAQLLALLSNAWLADPGGWIQATDHFLLESDDIRSSVQVVDSSTINLYSDRGALPVTVSNALDQPVTVYIEVRPQSAILSVENRRVKLTIEPNAHGRATVPVTSLSNGQVTVSVRLYDGAGNRIGDATTVAMNVQAGWETAGTLVFAGLVVAVFGFGLVRNIRKRRREVNE